MNHDTKIITPSWLAGAALVVAILSLAVSVYATRYSVNSTIVNSGSVSLEYPKNKKIAQVTTTPTGNGNLYYGMMQSKGDSKMKYTSKWKRSDSRKYVTIFENGYFKKNNVYYGDYKLGRVNKGKKYDIQLVKTAVTDKQSNLKMDYAVY